ncbi:Cytochrome c family protein [Granulibacter bethesdensis]|nr:Cytochrome c family protein [Granulibacter bethesdensis]
MPAPCRFSAGMERFFYAMRTGSGRMRRRLWKAGMVIMLAVCPVMTARTAETPAETLVIGSSNGRKQSLSAAALLARPDAQWVTVQDGSYGGTRRYRAVSLAALLGKVTDDSGVLTATASDGFSADLPLQMIRAASQDASQPQPWLAVEDPQYPWPPLPGKKASAGPFYIIWSGAGAERVSSEYWPYRITHLAIRTAPLERWPQLALSPDAPARIKQGQKAFIAFCLPCHRLNGAGDGSVGPDLGKPMNPTAYFQRPALHRYIRDPASVRDWPGRQMPGFSAKTLPDEMIEDIIDYMAGL